MNEDVARLARWLRRARPPRRALVRALVSGYVAALAGVALLVGAIALLVASAQRPGLRAVAVALVLIELFAFLRSPLRFTERMSAHRLGYDAVSTWRAWLVTTVGYLDYARWRAHASGELLERALGDTDELQELWLRFVVPLVDTLAVMLTLDAVVLVLPPIGHWWAVAVTLVVVEALSVLGLIYLASGELLADRRVREARGQYRATLVELSALAPEVTLLGRVDVLVARNELAVERLGAAERAWRRRHRYSAGVVLLAGLLALGSLSSHPATSSTWLVAGTVLALSIFELVSAVRAALSSAVEASGGGRRLESLAHTVEPGVAAWPTSSTLALVDLGVEEDGRVLVAHATATIQSGAHVALVGESGAGKSSLLRVLAHLDEPSSGAITIGGVAIDGFEEAGLRRHLAHLASEPGLTSGFAVDVLVMGREVARDPYADLASLGLASGPTTSFLELSRGERVRVALARAMASDPSIYLLDEPTAGLGRADTLRLLELVGATGSTVVIATHDLDVINWCDLVFELRDGVLLSR